MIDKLLKKDPRESYQFDLVQLETLAFHALEDWKKEDNDKTRTTLFSTIRDLTYAILCVGKYEAKHKINVDEIAYEYALYLFQRLILGTFVPEYQDRFPFQKYISINIKHVIITKNKDRNWHELLVDLEFLVNLENNGMVDFDPQHETVDFKMDRQSLAKRLYAALRIYYSENDIKRLMPMAMQLLEYEPKHFLGDNQSREMKDFIITLICISKKLLTSYNVNMMPQDYSMKEFKKIVSSSVRSTVFLSAVVNSEFFPKELLLAADLDSLYRLVSVAGGNTIRIPTKKELDAMIGTVVVVSKVIMEGKPVKQSLNEVKEDMGLVFPTRIRGTNINTYISKILEVHNIFGEDSNSEPIVHNLITAIKSIDKMVEHLVSNMNKESPEKILEYYREISTTFKVLTDGLAKIGTMAVGSAVNSIKEDSSSKGE